MLYILKNATKVLLPTRGGIRRKKSNSKGHYNMILLGQSTGDEHHKALMLWKQAGGELSHMRWLYPTRLLQYWLFCVLNLSGHPKQETCAPNTREPFPYNLFVYLCWQIYFCEGYAGWPLGMFSWFFMLSENLVCFHVFGMFFKDLSCFFHESIIRFFW